MNGWETFCIGVLIIYAIYLLEFYVWFGIVIWCVPLVVSWRIGRRTAKREIWWDSLDELNRFEIRIKEKERGPRTVVGYLVETVIFLLSLVIGLWVVFEYWRIEAAE